jgi:hypothetical protein
MSINRWRTIYKLKHCRKHNFRIIFYQKIFHDEMNYCHLSRAIIESLRVYIELNSRLNTLESIFEVINHTKKERISIIYPKLSSPHYIPICG